MWEQGIIDADGVEFRYAAKVYDEPSDYGINGGRVSILEIIRMSDNDICVVYDRKQWLQKPSYPTAEKALEYILKFYS